jgi:hypothetical protein
MRQGARLSRSGTSDHKEWKPDVVALSNAVHAGAALLRI